MRTLDARELQQVSGGAPKKWTKVPEEARADPGDDVTPLRGNRTGWCRGYGNMKVVEGVQESKHGPTTCGIA